MSSFIEEALKLSKEEKEKLYYALQEDLDFNDNVLSEEELTHEQWRELDKRTGESELGKSELLSLEAFSKKLKEKVDGGCYYL